MAKQTLIFLSRWFVNGIGLWLAVLLGIISVSGGTKSYIISALILAILNAVIRPILVVFALPFIVLSLGIFTVVINGIILYLLGLFYGNIQIDNFAFAVLAGTIVGLLNYIVTILFERFSKSE